MIVINTTENVVTSPCTLLTIKGEFDPSVELQAPD